MDCRRTNHALRQVLYLSVPESLAASISEAAPSVLHRRKRESGNDRAGSRTGCWLLLGLRAAKDGAGAQAETTRARFASRAHDSPRTASLAEFRLRCGSAGAS